MMRKRYQKRKEYLNNYQKNDAGQYVYTGDYYRMEGSEAEVKRNYLRLGCLSLVLLLSVIGSGCINAAGMSNTFYVILPYIAEVALLFAFEWQTVRIFASGKKIKAYVYASAAPKISPLAMGLVFVSAVSFVCSAVFMIRNGFENKMLECFLYLCLKTFTAVGAFTTSRFFDKIIWYKV